MEFLTINPLTANSAIGHNPLTFPEETHHFHFFFKGTLHFPLKAHGKGFFVFLEEGKGNIYILNTPFLALAR